MQKNKTMFKIVVLFLCMLITIGCKGHDEKTESVTKVEKQNAVFTEVIISKISDYQNPEIKNLEINLLIFSNLLKIELI